MKHLAILTFSLFLICTGSLSGQPSLEDILDKLPAESPNELDYLMKSLAELGAPAVTTLSSGLRSFGKADVKNRYDLGGLAKYLGKSQDIAQHEEIEGGFLKAIEMQPGIDLEVFLIEQLQFFGTDLSVERLESKIRTICEPVVQTMAQIHTDKALQVLLKAMSTSSGYCQHSIIKAVSGFDQPRAYKALVEIANQDTDGTAQILAMKGLASSGDPAAITPLLNFAKKDSEMGNDLLLTLGNVQAASGNKSNLSTILDQVNSSGSAAQKSDALLLAAKYQGSNSSKMLLGILSEDNNPMLSSVTSALVENESIPLAPFFKKIKKMSPAAQAGLLLAAKARDFKPALSNAKSFLSSTDPMLKIAAIKAVSSLEGKASIGDLQKVLLKEKNDQVLETASNEFSRWIGEDNLTVLSAALGQATGKNKVNLIQLISNRKLASLWPNVEPLLEDTDPQVRAAAFESLPNLTSDSPVADLIALVSLAENESEMASLESAFEQKAQQYDDKSEMVTPLLSAFGSSNPKLLGKVLPSIGGDQALEYIANRGDKEALISWRSSEALPHLFAILDKGRDIAVFNAILTQAKSAPTDQKVLYLRKLMSYAQNAQEKKDVLGGLKSAKSHTGFMYVSKMLDDPELKEMAAETLLSMALPATGEAYGLYGPAIKEQLMRADTILADWENAYSRAFLDKYLEVMPSEGGFVSMFNGVDLTGWQGLVGNPLTRDSMFTSDLKIAQQEADAKLVDNWKVEDGSIVFFGKGGDNLCSVKSYRDFELFVDWKLTKMGDSGLYLRGTPQVQIWDTANVEVGAQVGSGGLYNNKTHPSKPLTVADNPVNDWNTFRIVMIQDKVTVYLNGILVTDQVVLENYWNRALPIFREGPIELQAHGTNLQFRDIFVREIESTPDLTVLEQNDGYKHIFNGVNLDGWIGNTAGYLVEDGELIVYPGGGSGGNLFTTEEYDNFSIRFDFKLTPGANNGLGIHAPLEGNAAYDGKEIQILDNTAEKYANLHEYQYHGSVYGIEPAARGHLKPVGEWNTQEVEVRGNQIRVILNGQRILFADLNSASRNGTLDGKEHPGLKKLKGHIGFLGHGSEVRFRNIRLKVLEAR